MGNAPLPVKSLPVERTAEIVTHCGLIRAADDHTSVHALIVQLSITTSKYTQPPGPKSLTVRLFAAGQPFRVRSRGTDNQGLRWTRQRARKRRISCLFDAGACPNRAAQWTRDFEPYSRNGAA